MQNLVESMINAHEQIDSLMKGEPLKKFLKDKTKLKDTYMLGDKKSLMFGNNLIDALVESELNPNLKLEDMLVMSLAKNFGKNNNLNLLLSGGKDKAGLNLSYLFK